MCAALVVVDVFLLINQFLVIALPIQAFSEEVVYTLQAFVLFTLLLVTWFRWGRKAWRGGWRVLFISLIQAILVSTFLAFLLKLESYPDAFPYHLPAALLTLLAPSLFLIVTFISGMFGIFREDFCTRSDDNVYPQMKNDEIS